MDLVDDDEAQVGKEGRDLHVFVDQQGLKGFRSNLQNPPRLAQQLSLLGLGRIPVPTGDGDAHFLTQFGESPELVVDEGLQGSDI